MALSLLRLRRALSLSSSLIKHQKPFSAVPAITVSPSLSSVTVNRRSPVLDLIQPHHHPLPFNSRHFRSSSAWLSSARSSQRNNYANNEEIGPDTILFEGCDYNHWLITMDFPKDPAPTREEMIETYLQTLAKVVGSYEEAKKKMYAFSTTTYHGFQCLVTEEMSEKFKGLPGVVFVLPDSYIDPVNKEYGGDKYDNGVITPRPPPVQYGRQGGRYGDRNRDFNRNRPRGPPPNQQDNPAYANQGSIYGDTRNFGQQQNSPMQPNYGNQGPVYGDTRNFRQQQSSPMQSNLGNQVPTYGDTRNFGQQQNTPIQPNYVNSGPMSNYASGGAGDRRDPMAMNNAPGGRDPMPSYQATNNQNQQGYHNPQGGRIPPEQRDYGPGGVGNSRDSVPMYNAPGGGDPMPSYQATNSQNQWGYHNLQGGRMLPEHGDYMPSGQLDMRGDNRNYAPPQAVTYGQGAGGNYGQMSRGNYGQGVGAGQRHETGFGYGQTNSGYGEGQRFSQVEQRSNMHGEQGNYAQTGTDQN